MRYFYTVKLIFNREKMLNSLCYKCDLTYNKYEKVALIISDKYLE